MAYSQFFILNPKGDTIIARDYRGDITNRAPEIFFRNVVNLKTEILPVFNSDGVNFIYLKNRNLYFLLTTLSNVSPSVSFELLNRITKLIKDYCGFLSEDSIRTNFVLIYELLDEIMDAGYIQGTSTEHLKAFIYNEPVVTGNISSNIVPTLIQNAVGGSRRSTPSTSAMRPVTSSFGSTSSFGASASGGNQNELFVDLVEQMTVLFGANGNVLRSELDGALVIKSYLTGTPEVRLALNDDVILAGGNSSSTIYGATVLDDFNFHECANTQLFEAERMLAFSPPEGEFSLMNYRISSEFHIPFRLVPFVDELSGNRLDVSVKVRADLPEANSGNNVVLKIPVPKNCQSCQGVLEIGVTGQTVEYKQQEGMIYWTIKKFKGGSEHVLRIKIVVQEGFSTAAAKKEIGPINLEFDIPMFNASNIQIRYLRVSERNKDYQPHRWIRYITLSKSYIYRVW